MEITTLLQEMKAARASDLHLTPGQPPLFRVDSQLLSRGGDTLSGEQVRALAAEILSPEELDRLERTLSEVDLAFSPEGLGRYRVNAYRKMGGIALAIRRLMDRVPSLEELALPPVLADLTGRRRGLILVTGPTGSGKSTTLAAMIRRINESATRHIITVEDPIEYLHQPVRSVVTQRELGTDTAGFSQALRAALRQDPDVILVGEMRDPETISTALTAAETGHLVLSTLHTNGAVETINRIIDSYPPHQQQQIRVQLAANLNAVISQQLIPLQAGGRTAALEVLVTNPAIRHLIREGKAHQIQSSLQTGAAQGMQTMDRALFSLYEQGRILRDDVPDYSFDREEANRLLDRSGPRF